MTRAGWLYRLYGHTIAVNREFSRVYQAESHSSPDIVLHLGEEHAGLDRLSHIIEQNRQTALSDTTALYPPDKELSDSNHCHRICYSNGTEFLINAGGTEAWVQWPDDEDLDETLAFLTGPILGFMLRLQGTLCLHASVVQIDDHCVALLAPSGGGKSTTAAALAQKGFTVVSDDILVLTKRHGRYCAQVGPRGVRLLPDSLDVLFNKPDSGNRMTPSLDKTLVEISESDCSGVMAAIPLVAVYTRGSILSADKPEISSASGADALSTLLQHTYPGRYYRLPSWLRALELQQLNDLRKLVPLREVSYRWQIDELPDLCDAIVDDARALIRVSLSPDSSREDERVT